jgi:hypothetical protein
MKTGLDFYSTGFPRCERDLEEMNPDIFGYRLAEYLAQRLPEHGFRVDFTVPEDWGWLVVIGGAGFRLGVACANYDSQGYDSDSVDLAALRGNERNGFRCFVTPGKPRIQKWFRRVNTVPTIERLVSAVEAILRGRDDVSSLRRCDPMKE